MPKLSQNKIFLISITVFALIGLLFGFLFFSQNSQNKLANSSNSSQNSTSNNFNSSANSSQNQNLQTYTNPNYPNLKINYDNSWKIEQKTLEDSLKNERLTMIFQTKNSNNNPKLQSEQIILSKNETKLKVFLQMSSGFYTDNQYDAFGDLKNAANGDKNYRITNHTLFVELGSFTRSPQEYYDGEQFQKVLYKYFFKENPNSCNNARTKNFSNRNIKTNISVDYKKLSELKKAAFFEELGDVSCDNKLLFNLELILDTNNKNEMEEAEEIIKNSVFE